MNTKKQNIEIPGAPAAEQTTTAGQDAAIARQNATSATERPGAGQNAGGPVSRMVTLAPAFVALADEFGVVPERLAERVISAFAATKPRRITLRARAAACGGADR